MSGSRAALVLVDAQLDYLSRPGLVPAPDDFVASAADLLAGFRAAGAPVAHVRTIVRADGSDAMPHWRDRGPMPCVAGTAGAESPVPLAARPGEHVAHKQHYDGFVDPGLDQWLRQQGVGTVVVAGLYTHACVQATALRAYELGYDVVVASEAVASDDPEHAAAALRWIGGRAARVLARDAIHALLAAQPDAARVPGSIDAVVATVRAGQREWALVPAVVRAAAVERWADGLEAAADEAVAHIVDEVAKPRAAAQDEVRRAIAHLRAGAALVRDGLADDRAVADSVVVRRAPVGVVAAIMPWNNPVALPCGKLGPALALGNAIVVKPAPEAVRCARFLVDSARASGIPAEIVGLVEGGPDAGRALARHPGVDAVTVTGSIATGRRIAAACGRLGRPLQAELGGNNAAIVLADADLQTDIPALVRGAFSYSGQRCTAIRRLVIEEPALDSVVALVVATVADLAVGDPSLPTTLVGPLISEAARDRVAAMVQRAVACGARVVAQGIVPDGLGPGAWLAPTVLVVDDSDSEVVQQETFGPVLVVQPARDLDDAIAAANGVDQGLLLAVCTSSQESRARVLAAAEAGIVQLGSAPPAIHADAPFGGWKASGVGPPEHGAWDLEFLTRVQAVYGAGDP